MSTHDWERLGVVWLNMVGVAAGLIVGFGAYLALSSHGFFVRLIAGGIVGLGAATIWLMLAAVLALLVEIAEK
jgi:hypothetical protein